MRAAKVALVPRDNLSALLVGPVLWSAYFVISYLGAGLACTVGFGAGEVIAGISGAQALVLIVGGIVAALMVAAGIQAERGRRAMLRPGASMPAADAQRQRFLYTAALSLCGFSLIGTLWLAITALIAPVC